MAEREEKRKRSGLRKRSKRTERERREREVGVRKRNKRTQREEMAAVGVKIISSVIFLVAAGLTCDGQQLYVKHAPSYVIVQSQSPDTVVSSSDLHNVLAAPLGISNKQTPVIQSTSVLKRPKANVLFTVVTDKDQVLPVESVASIAVDWDLPFVNTEQMMNNLQTKFQDKDPVMLDLLSSNQFFDIKTSSPLFQSLPSSSFDSVRERYQDPNTSFFSRLPSTADKMSLNSSLSADGHLLAEQQILYDVISTLKNQADKLKTGMPDLLSFTLTGLPAVSREYGVNSEQAKDAQDIITKHLNQITEELKALYKGNVMVEVLTVPHIDTAKVRKTRSLMQAEASTSQDHSHLNLEIDWYSDFPVTFNIVLWLMVILVITVFFVAYGIWNLNPNLESILYRVPQDDLKKTN